jgi:hypothetical protein
MYVMLSVIVLSVVMLSVIMLCVVMLNDVPLLKKLTLQILCSALKHARKMFIKYIL